VVIERAHFAPLGRCGLRHRGPILAYNR
jgi:hypothetical protein